MGRAASRSVAFVCLNRVPGDFSEEGVGVKPFQRMARPVNAVVAPLVNSPRWGWLVGRFMAVITYTGRRSGRTITTPVGYSRRGEDVLRIRVEFPDKKVWWRNFQGEGGPISLRLRGDERVGHAAADRDDRGRVTVTVHLDPLATGR